MTQSFNCYDFDTGPFHISSIERVTSRLDRTAGKTKTITKTIADLEIELKENPGSENIKRIEKVEQKLALLKCLDLNYTTEELK